MNIIDFKNTVSATLSVTSQGCVRGRTKWCSWLKYRHKAAYVSMDLSTFVWHSRLYTRFFERAKLLIQATVSLKSSQPNKGNPN